MDNDKKIEAFDFIMEHVLKSGFATLNKSELDLIFFTSIMKNLSEQERSDYNLSRLLQITQTRVRNLKEKASVKYMKIERKDAIEIFIKKASHGHIDGQFVDIPLYDIGVKNELEAILDERNMVLHSQLNPKLFRIRLDDFLDLSLVLEAERIVENSSLPIEESIRSLKEQFVEGIKDNKKKQIRHYEATFGTEDNLGQHTFTSIKESMLKSALSLGIKALVDLVPGSFLFSDILKSLIESTAERV